MSGRGKVCTLAHKLHAFICRMVVSTASSAGRLFLQGLPVSAQLLHSTNVFLDEKRVVVLLSHVGDSISCCC